MLYRHIDACLHSSPRASLLRLASAHHYLALTWEREHRLCSVAERLLGNALGAIHIPPVGSRLAFPFLPDSFKVFLPLSSSLSNSPHLFCPRKAGFKLDDLVCGKGGQVFLVLLRVHLSFLVYWCSGLSSVPLKEDPSPFPSNALQNPQSTAPYCCSRKGCLAYRC
jgi:hypothetical protein